MQYIVTNIKYDTDGEDVDLPQEMTIDVPDDITDPIEIEEYLSDEISRRTNYCHFGYSVTPEIE